MISQLEHAREDGNAPCTLLWTCKGGLPPVSLPLPVGPTLFEIGEKRREAFDEFSRLMDSSPVCVCSARVKMCIVSSYFVLNKKKERKRKKEKTQIKINCYLE